MKTLVIANQKGGVGKSTLAVHLAWWAVKTERRVLVVDFDGQANSTHTFVDADSSTLGLPSSGLFAPFVSGEAEAPLKINGYLSLIGADMGINDVEGMSLDTIEYPSSYLQSYREDFDLCIIDTPPNLGRRLLAALIAGDAVISPMALNGYSIDGIVDLQRTIIAVKNKYNPRLKNLGILPNQVNQRSKTQIARLAELRETLGEMVLPFILPARVAVSDAVDRGHPVWFKAQGQSSVKAAKEMKAVVKEIMARLEK
ncbi:MAG: ParA family protein [Sedimenticola sp.]